MPPSRCWICLTFPLTASWPRATMAPSRCVVAAQQVTDAVAHALRGFAYSTFSLFQPRGRGIAHRGAGGAHILG